MKGLLSIIAGAALIFTTSCAENTGENMENQADTLGNRVENAVDNIGDRMNNRSDEDFVEDVIHANNKELRLLALAQKMGTNAEVKSSSKTMEADHKKMGDKVQAYATAKNITVDADNDTDDDLADDAKGADWDRKWVNTMVEKHEKLIKDFEDKQDDVQDAELKGIITEALPTLRHHLEMAKGLQQKLNK